MWPLSCYLTQRSNYRQTSFTPNQWLSMQRLLTLLQQGNHLTALSVCSSRRELSGVAVRPCKKTAFSVIGWIRLVVRKAWDKQGSEWPDWADLGLNAEQFKQIILLPANDFSLKEDSKTKTQILKKIFGTGILTVFKRAWRASVRATSDMEKRQAQIHFASQGLVWRC